MPESTPHRQQRALNVFTRSDASELRCVMHNWTTVDEVVLVTPKEIASKILRLLDSHAIAHNYESEARALDVLMRSLIECDDMDNDERTVIHAD